MATTAAKKKTDENPRQRFVRLGNARANKALDAIERIGNLTNGKVYEFTADDVRAVATALRSQVDKTEDKLVTSLKAGATKEKKEARTIIG